MRPFLGHRRFYAPIGGGAPAWTPAALGSRLRQWLDDRGQTPSTGISPWVDQSGNGNSISNATGTQQPALGTTINGWPAPKGDGSNDRLVTTVAPSDLWSTTAHHVFVVLTVPAIVPTSTNALLQDVVLGDSVGVCALGLRDATGSYEVTGQVDDGAQKRITSAISLSTPTLIEWAHTDKLQLLQVAGATTPTPVVTGTKVAVTGDVRYWCNYNATIFAEQAVAQIIVANAALTAAEVQRVRAYLAAKYAITTKGTRSLGKVLLVGDSITVGYSGLQGGWRVPLARACDAMGISAEFVGPYTNNGYAHRGVSGEKASEVSDLTSLIATYQPDTIVLAHGVNDLGAGDGVAALETAMSDLIDEAQAAAPSADIWMLSAVPPTSGAFFTYVADFTTWNTTNGPALATAQGITWVSIGSPAQSDGVHPTDTTSGYVTCARLLAAQAIAAT